MHDDDVISEHRGAGRGLSGWLSLGLAILATLLLLAANVAFWARHTLLDSGEFTSKVSDVLRRDEATERIGDALATQLLASGEVQQRISQALPSNASFLPYVLEGELQRVISGTLSRLLVLDTTQDVLERAARRLHGLVVSTLEGRRDGLDVEGNALVLHLEGVVSNLLDRLNLEAPPALQGREIGAVVVVRDAESLGRASRIVRAINESVPWLIGAAVVAFIASVLLARRKDRGVTVVGYGVAVAGLLSLIAWRFATWASSAFLEEAPVARMMIDGLGENLRWQSLLLIAIGAVVVVLADARIRGWLSGHAAGAWSGVNAFGPGRALTVGAAALVALLLIS